MPAPSVEASKHLLEDAQIGILKSKLQKGTVGIGLLK
jgi:hypothetical protein